MSSDHLLREAIVRLKEMEDTADIGDVLPIFIELADRITILDEPAIRNTYYDPTEKNKPLFDAFRKNFGFDFSRFFAVEIMDPLGVNPGYERFIYNAMASEGKGSLLLTTKDYKRMAVLLERLMRLTKTNKKANTLTKILPPKLPKNPLVQRLLEGMKNPKNKKKTQHEIAMGITEDDEGKARSIETQVRRYLKKWEAYKSSEHFSEQS
jgi:hypothetical protein